MSKKTYIHRNVNMMLYSHHMSPLLCWHNNVQTKCPTAALENKCRRLTITKKATCLRFSHVPQNMSPCLHISHVPTTCPHKLCSHKSKIKTKSYAEQRLKQKQMQSIGRGNGKATADAKAKETKQKQ